jgi:hypothetical protein
MNLVPVHQEVDLPGNVGRKAFVPRWSQDTDVNSELGLPTGHGNAPGDLLK